MEQKTLQEITLIDRTGTNSTKWDDLRASFGEDGLLPVWVADMDFKTPLCCVKPFMKRWTTVRLAIIKFRKLIIRAF